MKLLYLLLAGFILLGTAEAMKGDYLTDPPSIPQSCRIGIKDAKGVEWFCSSTQITSTELLTTAHCFNDYYGTKNLVAECPGEEQRPITVFIPQKDVKRKGQGPAIIRFEKPFATKPVCAASKEEIKALVALNNASDPKTCFYAGYGRDNSNQRGNFHRGRAKKLSCTDDGQIADEEGVIEDGDSGGSMYCADKKGRWFLVGVIEAGLTLYTNRKETKTAYSDSYETIRSWVDANVTGERGHCTTDPKELSSQTHPLCVHPASPAKNVDEVMKDWGGVMNRIDF